MKKIKSTDFMFFAAMAIVMLIHIHYVFLIPYIDDESFYALVPMRLINGDSLIQHEWHLSQFSSLFSYIPVLIWKTINGSTEGMFVFLRCIYLAIHTAVAFIIYAFFRKHGKWAVVAAIMFYVQVSYRVLAISYTSMFVIFLLLLTLLMLSIYEKQSTKSYILSGICFGGCCVCNPLFCAAFLLYFIACLLWKKRETILLRILEIKENRSFKRSRKLSKKQLSERKERFDQTFAEVEKYGCIFDKNAFIKFLYGALIMAAIAIVFFFATGGTISSIFNNFENLLSSSEYDVTGGSLFSKIYDTIIVLMRASLGMSLVLPLLFVAMLVDKKRTTNKHRAIYIFIALIWAILSAVGIFLNGENDLHAYSLPFTLITVISYALTENKNKKLFNLMYVPCIIGACFQYAAANTLLASLGIVFAIANIAGVFFVKDLLSEMYRELQIETKAEKSGKYQGACQGMLLVIIGIQVIVYIGSYGFKQTSVLDAVKAETGTYSGLYMSESEYEAYNEKVADMDYIKSITDEDDPVLLISYSNWMYLYLDRPVATYTAWYRGSINKELMVEYYKSNHKKVPKYIYVDSSGPVEARIDNMEEIFRFSEQELSNGVLLKVEGKKF